MSMGKLLKLTQKVPISFLVPTFNEEKNIAHCLESIKWADEIVVIDSFSTDQTKAICTKYGVKFYEHKFEGYARQKNWALDNLPFSNEWMFILDADERVSSELQEELVQLLTTGQIERYDGYYVNRRLIFEGKWMKRCGRYPATNLRLFRRQLGRYEEREVHEHIILNGKIGHLKNNLIHHDYRGIDHWIRKHHSFAEKEAREQFKILIAHKEGTNQLYTSDRLGLRRFLKEKIWLRLPILLRPFLRFIQVYIFQLGFLEGRRGLKMSIMIMTSQILISLELDEMLRGNAQEQTVVSDTRVTGDEYST
jgi:glycosyltransferase involved in cell wall biosynthesis